MSQEELLFKQRLHLFCQGLIDQKLEESMHAMEMAKEAILNDSKSTAGDKHETGRAMAHLEQEKIAQSLRTLQEQKDQLKILDPGKSWNLVQAGALVKTDGGTFYISTALGQVRFEEQNIYCISPQAPLFNAIKGKQKNEVTNFNGKKINILNII